MKTIGLCLAAGLLLAGTLSAQAQNSPDPDATAQQLVERIGPDRVPAATARNVLGLSQSGSNNTFILSQASTDTRFNEAYITQAGAANVLDLQQLGGANRATYSQAGTGNQTTLSQQGSANLLDGSLTGNQNELLLRQQGNNNQLRSTVAADGRQYDISQIGNNNSFTQRESAASTAQRGYTIEQRGNNMRLTIEQGRTLVP